MLNYHFSSRAFTAYAIALLIVALYAFSFLALTAIPTEETFWAFSDTWQIIKISLFQAFLSAFLATFLGLIAARAFFYLDFRGKNALYRLFSFAWALPSLVVIFAIIGVWGNNGWIGQFLPSFYGLTGILLAHLFLNIPLATKYSLESLQLISDSQFKLAAQLGFNGFALFRYVELPQLKHSLPYTFGNIFLLCFTSFPIVLMLGGGPKYSTLEAAIYQAVTFEFDFAKALHLIIAQMVIGLSLHFILELLPKTTYRQSNQWGYKTPLSQRQKTIFRILLCFIALFILLPLLNTVWQAVKISDFFAKLASSELWRATLYSLGLSTIAAISVIGLSYFIALETRWLQYQQRKWQHSLLSSVIMLPVLLPVFLLAVGLFLWLMDFEPSQFTLILIVGFCNGLMLLPYVYRILYPPMLNSLIRYHKLAQNLGLTGWRGWWIVEKNTIFGPLASAFALAFSASLGSFSVIAFFGNNDFTSLPYLLYRQIGSYRIEEAALTALILMLVALFPFLFTQWQDNHNDKNEPRI